MQFKTKKKGENLKKIKKSVKINICETNFISSFMKVRKLSSF